MNGKEVFISGGSGTLGNELVRYIKKNYEPRGIRVFSRSELRQARMETELKEEGLNENVEFIVGDIQNERKIRLAMRGVDIVIHTAALKRIDTAEKDPLECININILGTQNVVYASLEQKVEKAILISTDKAVYPITLYGYTKGCAESLFLNANVYSGKVGPKFSVIRYGNVIDSNGSVIEIFKRQVAKGLPITITDPAMTRFWIKAEEVVRFICESVSDDSDCRLYIPKMRSSTIKDLADVIAPFEPKQIIGLRCNEKMHEVISEDTWSSDSELLMDKEELTEFLHGCI